MKAANRVLSYALFYLNNNLSVVPIKFKDKTPLIRWEKFQHRLPTEEEIKQWFSDPNRNIAIVCGAVSRNLIVLDFDDKQKFNEFLTEIAGDEKLVEAVKNTWVVETGKGVHIYFRTMAKPESKNFANIKVNLQGEGRYVVAPPSIHPSGKEYTFKQDPKKVEIYVLSEELHEELLKVLEKLEKKEAELKRKTRKLTDEQKFKIVSLLLPYWTEGRRHKLALMIAGALYWHDYALEDAIDVVKQICEKAKDEETEDRIRAVKDTYLRALDRNIAYKTWLREAGIIGEEYEKLVTKLLEIIKGTLVLGDGKLSVKKNHNTLIVCDFKDCTIKEYKIRKDDIVLSDIISTTVPEEVTVIQTEDGEFLRVTFRTSDGYKFSVEGDISEISNYLKRSFRVTSRTKFEDAFSLIVSKMIQINWCEIIRGEQVKGLIINDNHIVPIDYSTNYTSKELKDALLILDKFVRLSEFNPDRVAKVAKIVKWFVVAGLGWCFKQVNKFLPHLYLYGESDTGKTATAKLLSNIWLELPMLSLGSIDSPYRLGLALSQHTFPVVINEMDFDALDSEVIEMWKNAVDGKIVRSRYGKNVKAYAVFCFTSNTSIPSNRAIQKRLVIIHFDPRDSEVLVKQKDEFEKLYAQREKLGVIGKFVAEFMKDKVELLRTCEWEKLAEIILEEAYKIADLKVPEWIHLTDQEEEDTKQNRAEKIRAVIFDELAKVVRELDEDFDFSDEEDVRYFLKEASMRISWLVFRQRSDTVVLLTSVLDTLKKHGVKLPNLRDLSYYIPNSEYKTKVKVQGRVVSGIIIDPLEFIKWLGFESEEEDDIGSEEGSNRPPRSDDTRSDESEKQEKDKPLDETEKEIVEIANKVMELVPNQNYQIDLFVKEIKARMSNNLHLALEKLEKLLERGVLQSHFNIALERLKRELKVEKEQESKEKEEQTKESEKEVKDKEEAEKGRKETERTESKESESERESVEEDEDLIPYEKMLKEGEVKEFSSSEEMQKYLVNFVKNLKYNVDPENW